MGKPYRPIVPVLITALILAGCGGGGSSDSSGSGSFANTAVAAQSGTASDGFARFNYWRSQLGLTPVSRNAQLDAAAQGHSEYQAYNNVITHYQTVGKPYFTGVCLTDDSSDPNCNPSQTSRIERAQYPLPPDNYAVGEVIASTDNTSGSAAADALIDAVYHRFVIFEPMFKEAGAGAATSSSGSTYFTVDFAAIGLDQGLGWGQVAVFPKDGQNPPVPISFSSDSEIPDPVGPDPVTGVNPDVVGYPISVHADIIYTLSVASFTVAPHGGSALPAQKLWPGVDKNTGSSEAAIVPLSPLQPNTTYDVQFSGTMIEKDVHGVVSRSQAINLNWSFTTRP